MSDDKKENVNVKTLIACLNFGLLENGGSTNQHSMVFRSLKEASIIKVSTEKELINSRNC